jgi:hypothetical protein
VISTVARAADERYFSPRVTTLKTLLSDYWRTNTAEQVSTPIQSFSNIVGQQFDRLFISSAAFVIVEKSLESHLKLATIGEEKDN